jgi:probable rRNA maturation factor
MKMTDITIKNLQKRFPVHPAQVTRLIKNVLKHERIQGASLSVAFVTAQRMQTLNQRYLQHHYPTDVLAFYLKETKPFRYEKSQRLSPWLQGEIIICPLLAKRNAKIYQSTIKEELSLYVIHGLLHLLGFRDHASRDIRRMRQKEEELMRLFVRR